MAPKTDKPAPTGMLAVMHYFDMKIGDFKTQWAQLTDADKTQLKTGVDNGTLTY
jgi:hypothetical protein